MSTRCQIGFYQPKTKDLNNFEALIYRHSDGYPEGVLPEIVPFLERWKKDRGLEDSEYASARLLQHLCNDYDGRMEVIEKRHGNNRMVFAGILGYGISKEFHGDIEYHYAVYPDRVDVYQANLEDINRSKKIRSTKLTAR